uniref:ABC transporter F family member 4-like n=1 Tax=Nicotiana sylvestris TaxID=4096 RepID=A0A1U7XFS4_NICSY|nr:PREDICTED: ABC transporter F family member 4-like [Nicotiana sylvestris]
MANPSQNPSSPPKESSPTPLITLSTIPTSNKGSFKMLAHKVVAGSEQIKKVTSGLNIASDVITEVAKNLESRFILVGTIAGLRKSFQEPVPSVQEPLEDLLKRVSDSYNPKKKKSSEVKILGTARENKKRKVAFHIPIETPNTRERAIRSPKKQSEAELERALEESKRKVAAKGKKKISEPIKSIEIEEMEPIFHDEDEAEEHVDVDPSTLVRRTRSVRKSVQAVEEEEESEEEEDEADEERDKVVKFDKRTMLKGRLLTDLEEEGIMMLLEKLELQGWKDMVLQMKGRLARAEIVEFMANCEIKNGKVTSVVKGGDCEL